MKTLLLFLATSLLAQTTSKRDDMDLYYLVFLRPAPLVQPLSKPEAAKLEAAHMNTIHTMADAGILVAAGPVEEQPPTIADVMVLKAASPEQAWTLAGMDPLVIQRRTTVDVHSWMGPKGLGTGYVEWKREHPSDDDKMVSYTMAIYERGPRYTPAAAALHDRWVAEEHKAGKLAAAGSIDKDDPEMVALTVFKSGVEDAKKLAALDPSIKSGAYRAEFHKWWSADQMLPW